MTIARINTLLACVIALLIPAGMVMGLLAIWSDHPYVKDAFSEHMAGTSAVCLVAAIICLFFYGGTYDDAAKERRKRGPRLGRKERRALTEAVKQAELQRRIEEAEKELGIGQ